MKCAIFECQRQRRDSYLCCTTEHGSQLNLIRRGLDSLFDADDNTEDELKGNGRREHYTIEEVEHYSKYVS